MSDEEKSKSDTCDVEQSTADIAVVPASVSVKEGESSPEKNVTYENGEAIYTDEATKYKYKWCKESKQWKPLENEHYKWCDETQKWIPKVPLENEYYRWCDRTNQWIPKMKKGSNETEDSGVYGYDEKEKHQTYTDKDGAVFFWVRGKKQVIMLFEGKFSNFFFSLLSHFLCDV